MTERAHASPGAAEITAAVGARGLAVLGGFHPGPADSAPETCGTLLLLGPGPDFWPIFADSPERRDGGADPLDRWSARVVGGLAREFGAQALFPFGGPPFQPFLAWARRGGRAWSSPVGMLVHAEAGLFVSYRAALAFGDRFAVDDPAVMPCPGCAAPCLSACPVGALTGAGYDVPRCHAHLDTPAGAECLGGGCLVRRACPVGPGQPAAQSAFHMAAFHKPLAGQRAVHISQRGPVRSP